MVSSWLPQNLQKRIFKYALSRLSVFSNLDLENVDVSVGTTSNFSVNDVQLDPEKINIPGVFLRDGRIQRLDLKLGVLGGIQCDGSAIDLIIALSQPRIDDLTELLSRTTANLAQSLVLPGEDEERDGVENATENEGFGFGEFKTTVAKVVDAAISQLTINLRDISIKLIIDHETTLQLSVGKASLRTVKPGIRHVVISDLEVVLLSPDLEFRNIQETEEQLSEEHLSEEQPDVDPERSQMMESMLFSHEEASTMYMSALSTVLEAARKAPPKPRVVWCDKADVRFKGLVRDIVIDVGRVHATLDPLPIVVLSLIKKYQEIIKGAVSQSSSLEHQDDDGVHSVLSGISVAETTLSVSPLLPNGLFEDPSKLELHLKESSLIVGSNHLLTIDKISASAANETIVTFNNTDEPESDLTCSFVSDIKILFPNPASLNVSLTEIGPLLSCLRELASVISFSRANSTPSRSQVGQSSSNILLQTNTFDIVLSTGNCASNITLFPVTLKSDIIQIDKVVAECGNDSIEIHNLSISLSDNGVTHIIRQDSVEVQAEVTTKLTIDKILIDGTHSSLTNLLKDFQAWTIPEWPYLIAYGTNGVSTPKLGRGVQIATDSIPFSARIGKVESKLELPDNLGIFELDCGTVVVNLISSNSVQVEVSSLYLSRDFSDIDPTIKHVPLIYNTFPSVGRPIIFAELVRGELRELKLTGLSIGYHIRLLKLLEMVGQTFGKDEESKTEAVTLQTKKLSDSASTIRQSTADIIIFLVDCIVELEPFDSRARGLLVINDGETVISQGHDENSTTLTLSVRKSWLLLIDDIKYLDKTAAHHGVTRHIPSHDLIGSFAKQGYTVIASLSSLKLKFNFSNGTVGDLTVELVTIESCADSTQTLIELINGLKTEIETSSEAKYRTEPALVDTFEGIDDNAFGDHSVMRDDISNFSEDLISDDLPSNLDFVESYYTDKSNRSKWSGSSSGGLGSSSYSKADLLLDQDLNMLAAKSGASSGTGSSLQNSDESFRGSFGIFEQRVQSHDSVLAISEDYMANRKKTPRPGSAETAGSGDTEKVESFVNEDKSWSGLPVLRLNVFCQRIIWKLYDGYDWAYTRETITQAVKRVEVVANEVHRQLQNEREHVHADFNDREDSAMDPLGGPVVGDLLFNSIYVGIPADQDPSSLRHAINRNIGMNDDASASTSVTATRCNRSRIMNGTARGSSGEHKRQLKLQRSKRDKVSIQVDALKAELVVYETLETVKEEDGTLLNRVNLRVGDLEIIDNVPTSTWKKFLFYMRSAGEREPDAGIAHVVLDSVKPVRDLAVSELILVVSVLPLRLHVDQDTLDFLTRFFEFKDDRIEQGTQEIEDVFIQRAEIRAIKVKLDYKPKKVDYAGLKSGHTTEFMNFFVLDEADIILRHIELYGVSGFPKLTKLLNGSWMPDIRSTQLGDVLAGLAPVRSLVRLGSGVRDLIWIPVEEYRKDGRLVRGIQKGAWTFAKSTTTELVKLGAKLAAGTQAILESAEQAMGGSGAAARTVRQRRNRRYVSPYSDNLEDYEDEEDYYHDEAGSAEELESPEASSSRQQQKKVVSLYADQPHDIKQGINLAYQSLGRNISMATRAVQEIGPDTAQRGARGAAAAVAKAAPVAFIRPLIGTTEAVSKALLGITNQLDPEQMKYVEDVS